MPNLNIFYLDEEEYTGEDPLQQASLAAAMAWADADEWQRIHWHQQHLQADGDDNIPDAALMAFTGVHELIKRETALQQKKNAETGNHRQETQLLELDEEFYMLDVVEVCVITCYYALIVACFFLALSLLGHT